MLGERTTKLLTNGCIVFKAKFFSLFIVFLSIFRSADPEALTKALKVALDAGYPLIDTAYVYGNEGVIGKVLQEYFTSGKLKRENIFITTKVSSYHLIYHIVRISEKLKSHFRNFSCFITFK